VHLIQRKARINNTQGAVLTWGRNPADSALAISSSIRQTWSTSCCTGIHESCSQAWERAGALGRKMRWIHWKWPVHNACFSWTLSRHAFAHWGLAKFTRLKLIRLSLVTAFYQTHKDVETCQIRALPTVTINEAMQKQGHAQLTRCASEAWLNSPTKTTWVESCHCILPNTQERRNLSISGFAHTDHKLSNA